MGPATNSGDRLRNLEIQHSMGQGPLDEFRGCVACHRNSLVRGPQTLASSQEGGRLPMAPDSGSPAGIRHRGERTRRPDALHPISARPRLRSRHREVLCQVRPPLGRQATAQVDRGGKTTAAGNGYQNGYHGDLMTSDRLAIYCKLLILMVRPARLELAAF